MILIVLAGINMGFFIERAEAMLVIENSHLRLIRKQNALIEDNYLKCIGKECDKSRDSIVIDGSYKLVLPSMINLFADPLSIMRRPSIGIGETRQDVLKLLSRLTCLKHVLNGLAGFVSPSSDITFHNICRDLKLRTAYLDKLRSKEVPYKSHDSPVFPFIDLDNDEDLESLEQFSNGDNWLFIKTPVSRRRFFDIKRRAGKWLIELLSSYKLIRRKTVLIGLNWISSAELNYIASIKPVILTSPSQSMNTGEHSYLPVKPLLSNKVPVVLFSGNYSTLGFNLYSEYPLFYLLTRFLYGVSSVDYDWILASTILVPQLVFGLNSVSLEEDSKPTLTILNIASKDIGFENIVINPLVFHESTVEYLFIDGEAILTPSNKYEFLSEFYEVMDYLKDKEGSLEQGAL